MRYLVQPPPLLRCDLCHGELRLKELVPDGPSFEFDIEILVCAKCGHEKSHRVGHDRYVAHTASNMRPTKAG